MAKHARGSTNHRRPILWLAVLVALIAGGAYFWHIQNKKEIRSSGLVELFDILSQQGYTPNVGFSGEFVPGTIIQIKEDAGAGQERVLATPITFAWPEQCFPGLAPHFSSYTLPNTQGTSTAGLTIGMTALLQVLPSLDLQNDILSDYSLTIKNPSIHSFGKGEISGNFAPVCVKELEKAIKQGGDQASWYNVITESVTANSLVFHLQWKDNTKASARAQVLESVRRLLLHTPTAHDKQNSHLEVGVTRDDAKITDIAANGDVVLAYRARPLVPLEKLTKTPVN